MAKEKKRRATKKSKEAAKTRKRKKYVKTAKSAVKVLAVWYILDKLFGWFQLGTFLLSVYIFYLVYAGGYLTRIGILGHLLIFGIIYAIWYMIIDKLIYD